MNIQRTPSVSVNGREYKFPKTPTVCVCLDGSEPGYIERAIDAGLAPNFSRLMQTANLTALSAMPSFTNPNNISIITVHRRRPPGDDRDVERRELPARADNHAGLSRCGRQ